MLLTGNDIQLEIEYFTADRRTKSPFRIRAFRATHRDSSAVVPDTVLILLEGLQ